MRHAMSELKVLEVPVKGMDCAECTQHVQHAIAALPGIEAVDVFLASEKAIIKFDPSRVDLPTIRQAVAGAGYSVPASAAVAAPAQAPLLGNFNRRLLTLLGVVFGAALLCVVSGGRCCVFAGGGLLGALP